MARQSDVVTKSLTITDKTQADRVTNLIAMMELDGGKPMKFSDLTRFMENYDSPISKSTWHALRDPDYRVVKVTLLEGVAAFFGVDPGFLMYEEAQPTEKYLCNLDEMTKKRTDDTVELFYRHAQLLPDDAQSEVIDGYLSKLPTRVQEDVVSTLMRRLSPGSLSAVG